MKFQPSVWVATLSVLVATAIHAYVAWTPDGPLISADEIGAVGNAATLAHGAPPWILTGNGYMPGMGSLLAPLWLLTDDPFLVYRGGLVIGVLLALAAIWPLALLARHVGVSNPAGAVTLAAVITIAPSRVVQSNYVLSEHLLTLVTAWCAVFAMRAATSGRLVHFCAVGALAGASFFTHGRGMAVVAAAGVWALLFVRRSWRASTLTILSAGVTSAAAFVLYRWITHQMYFRDLRVEETFFEWWRHSGAELAGTFSGLAWYAMAAWPAIAIGGFGLMFKRLRRDRGLVFVLLCAGATVTLALIQLDKSEYFGLQPRIDAWIYGRYIDHILTIAAVIGLSILVRVRSRVVPLVTVVTATAISGAFLLFTLPNLVVGGKWVDMHIPGMSFMLSTDNYAENRPEPWLLLVAIVFAFTVLVLAAARFRAAVLVLALFWALLAVAFDTTSLDVREGYQRLRPEYSEVFKALPQGSTVDFDSRYSGDVNFYSFLAYPTKLELKSLDEALADNDPYFMTSSSDERPAEIGAVREGERLGFYVLWRLPET